MTGRDSSSTGQDSSTTSRLFKTGRCITSIVNMEIRKQVLSLVRKLSIGWRQHNTRKHLSDVNWNSQWMEHFKVNEQLRLVWSVCILEENSNYIQVLKVWDVLPLFDIPRFAKQIEIFYAKYPVDIMNWCKFRCIEGNIEVPMSWPVNQTDHFKDGPVQTLCDKFALLSLSDKLEVSTASHRYHQRWWSLGILSKVPRASAHHTL